LNPQFLVLPCFEIRNQNDRLYADLWDDVDEDDDTVSALMAATSQYGGKLEGVIPPNMNTIESFHYAIPAPHGPTLPANGDYSLYTEWGERANVIGYFNF